MLSLFNKISISADIELLHDTENDKYEILSCKPRISKVIPIYKDDDWVEKVLTTSEVKFGYLSFNKTSKLINYIIPGKNIKLRIINKEEITTLNLNVHKTVHRIDKLTKFYRKNDIKAGQKILLNYSIKNNTMEIKI